MWPRSASTSRLRNRLPGSSRARSAASAIGRSARSRRATRRKDAAARKSCGGVLRRNAPAPVPRAWAPGLGPGRVAGSHRGGGSRRGGEQRGCGAARRRPAAPRQPGARAQSARAGGRCDAQLAGSARRRLAGARCSISDRARSPSTSQRGCVSMSNTFTRDPEPLVQYGGDGSRTIFPFRSPCWPATISWSLSIRTRRPASRSPASAIRTAARSRSSRPRRPAPRSPCCAAPKAFAKARSSTAGRSGLRRSTPSSTGSCC